MLRVRLFGSGRISDGDDEIKLPSREWTLPLLAYLALHAGEVIPRRRLAFALWPDDSEDIALRNLRRNFHRLVQAFPPAAGEPWLMVSGHSVAWNTSSGADLDVAEFERLRADSATLEQAVALYAGDLLPDIYYDWVAAERERLRSIYQADLGTLILLNRRRRAFAEAALYAQRLLASDPWHEDALRQLMSVRYESGDAAGALAEFDLFARSLRAEMNIEPMPETVALRDAVARGAPIPGATSPPLEVEAKRTPILAPFVGREDELGRLRGQWLRAARGTGSLVFVSGEAGIGKSRLVSELALIAQSEGGRVISGTTSSPERDPYQCLSMALRGALPLVAGISLAPPLLAAIADLVPELRAHRPDVPSSTPLGPDSERARLFDALAQAFAALARPRPVLVILEDLHRAGAATLEAIGAIAPRLTRSPILFVATYRHNETARSHPLRTLIHATRAVSESIDVGPLNKREVGLLVAAIAPGGATTPDFLTALIRRSGGNPLFVTELLHDRGRAGPESFVVPPTVSAMMQERVASLAPASRTVAEIAAVAGEAFTVDMVREIARLPEGELLDGLDELLDRHLVRESTERGRYEYAFTHHLVHAAIYEGISTDARTRRHRRVARILETTVADNLGEQAGEIALHFERGGEPTRAAVHYASAARRAAQLNANVEACALVARALALDPGSDRERFELLLLRSKMNSRVADAGTERAELGELEEVASRLGEDAICTALWRRVDVAYRQGDDAAEVEAIERLAQHAALAESERWLAQADEVLARREEREGEFDQAIETAIRACERHQRLNDDVSRARLTSFAARLSSLIPDRVMDAERLAFDAVTLADRTGDIDARIHALRDASCVAQERHDHVRSAELSRLALAASLEVGDRLFEADSRNGLGVAYWSCWQIDEALFQLREALHLGESLGSANRVQGASCDLGAVLIDVGKFSEAIECCRRAADATLMPTSASTAAVASVNAADAAWQCGDIQGLSAALDYAAPIVERLPESRFLAAFVQNQGRLLRCRREFDASASALERALALNDRAGRWENAVEVLDDLALTYLASGQLADAGDALKRGTDMLGDRPRPYVVRHHWIEACVYRATGASAEAREALGRAHAIYVERTAALAEPGIRASFEAIPMHRALCAAVEFDAWPSPESPCVVAFPAAPKPKSHGSRSTTSVRLRG